MVYTQTLFICLLLVEVSDPLKASFVRFSIASMLCPSAAHSVVRESRSSAVSESVYTLASIVTSSLSVFMFVFISSRICFVSLLTALSTISCISLSFGFCLAACGAYCATMTVPTSVVFTSRNPSFFSISSSGLSDPSRLLGCGWKVTYLPKMLADFFTRCL